MNPPKKLTTQQLSQETQEASTQQNLEPTVAAHEFPTVEAMLRHDRMHTPVPPSIGQRLEKSIGPKGTAARSWWRRWLGGRS